ncbi:MAG: P1 family peptidase [Firmicutes bacterium]|nr:P1 family peptidase [Bacillota bacterium]
MKEISIQDVCSVRIGQVEDRKAGTGCTVFLCPEGMRAGLDIRGGGPAARESQLLDPLMAAQVVHAIVLAGGSAFGLNAAGGVMKYLEEQDIGFDVGVTKVPLVCQSDLFDLTVGDPFIRPDETMGYAAARQALTAPNYRDGNYGAGCGATVGKLGGMETCTKTGIGSFALQAGDLKIGAVVALNALGDVFDWRTGTQVAGLLTADRTGFRSSLDQLTASIQTVENRFVENTTLGVILTNARFEKAALCKIAGMGHDGYARSIRPVHTSFDGDSIYAVSAGEVAADQEVVGSLAAEVISQAILRAVESAESAYGFLAARDLAK